MKQMLRPTRSSLGKKYLMAVTGLLLIGFVLAHLSGNLLIFAGPDAINSYAQMLKAKPALLWAARSGLLFVFLVHLFLAVRLTLENRAARPDRYVYEDTLQATWASRHMMLTGLLLLAFIGYHLAHFTLGWVKDSDLQAGRNYLDLAEVKVGREYVPDPKLDYSKADKRTLDARHDVYSMMVDGFRTWWVSVSYLLAMAVLGLHLWHGGSSFLQSLGLNNFRYARIVRCVGPLLASAVVFGNCSIVLSVWLGVIG